jgi:hypothetical protein
MPSPYQQCHAFDTNDSIALRWSRAENKAKITISSSPAGDGMSLSQAIKSPHYLKEVPKYVCYVVFSQRIKNRIKILLGLNEWS